jgi:CHAD domain-containing protein
MGQSATLEREIKFDAAPEFALPDLRPLVGRTERLREERLVTTYFETSDLRLWREGLTLRHRKSGDADGIWTLKVPHGSDKPAMERSELSCPGPVDEVPKRMMRGLRGVARRAPLRPLVTLETSRRRLILHGEWDEVLAELDDDLVLVVGGQRDGQRFRQVELELLTEEWDSREVVGRIETAGARMEQVPKLAKAASFPSEPSFKPVMDRHASLAIAVKTFLRSDVERLVGHDWRIRLALPEPRPRDVHQARVATRRLRSNLKTFGAVLDPVWTQHVRGDLKWLGAALGDVRDADVLAEQLNDAPEVLQRRLAQQRKEAGRRLTQVLDSERYVNLLDKLHAGAERLVLAPGAEWEAEQPARDYLPSLIRNRWRAVRRRVRRAGADPSARDLHLIRIKSKQLRYAAEAAVPVVGSPAKRTALAAERVQTVLGQHHDAVAGAAWLRSEVEEGIGVHQAGVPSAAVAFEAGCLTAELQRSQRKASRRWTRAWKDLAKPKTRGWLRTG